MVERVTKLFKCFVPLYSALGEVVSKRKVGAKWEFYMHYVSCESVQLTWANVCMYLCNNVQFGKS